MARAARLSALTSSALLLIATIAAPAVAGSGTTTRWVDDDGNAGPNGCGGSATAKKTIQKAVDASDANDVVLVCPGTYVGTVLVRGSRDGLTLKSTTKWGAVIMPPVLSGRPTDEGLVSVRGVDDVTLQWFKIVFPTTTDGCRFWPAGAGAFNADRVAIRGLLVRAQGQETLGDCRYARGISVSESDDALVAANTIIDFAWHAVEMNEGTGTIHDNSVRYFHPNYDQTESGRGIQAEDGRYRITNNIIRALATGGVSTPGYESGIDIQGGSVDGTIIRI